MSGKNINSQDLFEELSDQTTFFNDFLKLITKNRKLSNKINENLINKAQLENIKYIYLILLASLRILPGNDPSQNENISAYFITKITTEKATFFERLGRNSYICELDPYIIACRSYGKIIKEARKIYFPYIGLK